MLSDGLELYEFEIGSFRVLDGFGGTVTCSPRGVGIVFDPQTPNSGADTHLVTKDPQVFHVRALKSGIAMISFRSSWLSLPGSVLDGKGLALVVKEKKSPRNFDAAKGVEHNHPPCGKWSEIQKSPRTPVQGPKSGLLNGVCMGCDNPRCVVNATIAVQFSGLPLALQHLNWYLSEGRGRDFEEDGIIVSWIKQDVGIRRALRSRLPDVSQRRGKHSGFFEFETNGFENMDYQFSFGSIDKLFYEFDFSANTVSVWFMDRYEWHPCYPDLYPELPGDFARETNCLHAALVELKSEGAADYWMKGEATVPIDWIMK